MHKTNLILYAIIAFAVLQLAVFSESASIGTAYIYAPAVITSVNKGTITTFYLNVTYGNGNVSIIGPSSVGNSTLDSAEIAANYASQYLGLNEKDYNFTYTISDSNVSVSGPSGGLAFTLLVISALSHIQLLHDFTLTGTISQDGSIGQIGGVYDKISAAQAYHLNFGIVPYAENGSFEDLLYYLIQQKFDIPLVEVSNVSQALAYASGKSTPKPLSYSIYTNYNLNELPYANISCTAACNESAFLNLTDFTFNFTNSTIAEISNKYLQAKSMFESMLGNYSEISSKGYLYPSADLSFLAFTQAFLLANANNINIASASSIIKNVSAYCSSLVPPQMTNTNYEYVIGGELRQSWGNITATAASAMLNASDTSDGIAESIYTAGEAYGWCSAANKMYSIASSMSGTPVGTTSSLESSAKKAIDNASQYGSSLYTQSAVSLYESGYYPSALYDAEYALVFDNPVMSNYTTAQMLDKLNANIYNSTYGTWPYQFALSSLFYRNEWSIAHNQSYLQEAYTMSKLAYNLNNANKLIVNSFVAVPYNQAINSTVLEAINQKIDQLYILMFVVVVILFMILIILLIMLLTKKNKRSKK
jgi:predicted S18 family serine protease